jgi:hypothetical protein
MGRTPAPFSTRSQNCAWGFISEKRDDFIETIFYKKED